MIASLSRCAAKDFPALDDLLPGSGDRAPQTDLEMGHAIRMWDAVADQLSKTEH